jgi:hypothetical protein
MPLIAYRCKNCQSDFAKETIAAQGEAGVGKALSIDQEVFTHKWPMPKIGSKIKCRLPGCTNKMERVFTAQVGIIIRGHVEVNPNHNCFSTQVNGSPVNFSFIDHEHTSSSYQASVSEAARATGIKSGPAGLGNMHRNKDGRNVVSVASNVPDPLGVMERAKRSGGVQTTTAKVNTPTRRRKAA